MSFLRHAEIYRSDVVYKTVESLGRAAASRWSAPGPAEGRSPRTAPCSSSAMSFRAGYSLAGCSPAEPASASPTALSIHCGLSAGNDLSANGNLSLVSVPQHRGAVQRVADLSVQVDSRKFSVRRKLTEFRCAIIGTCLPSRCRAGTRSRSSLSPVFVRLF